VTRSPSASGPNEQWPAAEPTVAAWELKAYYRRLKSAIIAFESAWEEGTIETALADRELAQMVGRDILASYDRLRQHRRPRTTAFRRNSIHALLEPVKELLSEPRRRFPASPLAVPPSAVAELENETDLLAVWWQESPLPLPAIRQIATVGPQGELALTIDQVIAARTWGIGFEFDDPAAADSVATLLARLALHRVAADLRDLEDIELWLELHLRRQDEEVSPDTHIVPDIPGRRFEQLMLDVLNEQAPVARRAPLYEDFVEKTDLRIHVPGLNRRRGARIQVTQTTFQDRLEEKLARIRRVNEVIILSPRSLADALDQEEGLELLSPSELDRFWGSFPRLPMTVGELAKSVKRSFLAAIRKPHDDPRGPTAQVPEPLRHLVVTYVTADAYRTTSELRERERRSGREPTRVIRRQRRNRKPPRGSGKQAD
jgi:hypothetical protein